MTVLVSLVVATLQPLDAPWWVYADADATYVASGLNLMRGKPTFYLDHPGMPLQELIAATAEGRYAAHRLAGGTGSAAAYAEEQILRLDEWRPYYRAFSVLFYVAGAAIAFLACLRLLGHWGFGLAAGLLWIGAPGLVPMSIQYRSDVPLAVMVLLTAFLLAMAAIRRDARLYTLTAFVLGLTLTVKVHAAGLIPALVAGVVLRAPDDRQHRQLLAGVLAFIRRHRLATAAAAVAWLTLVVTFNVDRFPPDVTREQQTVLIAFATVFAGYLVLVAAAARHRFMGRIFHPLNAVLAGAFALGVALPATLFVGDGLQMFVSMKDTLLGKGVNEGIEPFALAGGTGLDQWPLRQGLVVVALAGVSAVVALRRRTVWPALLFLGAAVLALMAAARLGAVHYFAPAYVVAIPAALWLFRRGRLGAVGAAVLVAYVTVPQLAHVGDAREAVELQLAKADAAASIAASVLEEGQVAIVDPAAPTPDGRYNALVEIYLAQPPGYPNRRFLDDMPRSLQRARADGLVFRYYIGGRALGVREGDEMAFSFADYRVRPLPELARPELEIGVVELVAGPGVDRPYDHPDAPYDAETGYFKDPAGRYFDVLGNPVSSPPKRRYVDGLWLDAYGDFWNERGELVRSDPTLRTAP